MTSLPLVALVGRPNVGKSTLFNRLTGTREALVFDRPGVTRDRLFGTAIDGNDAIRVVDTGGFDSDPHDPLLSRMREQTQLAIDEADLVLLVLDGADGLAPADREVAQLLRKSGKAVLGVVNKIDVTDHEDRVADFYAMGLDTLVAVSAEHGRGTDDLWDEMRARVRVGEVEALEAEEAQQLVEAEEPEGPSRVEWKGGPIRVAVVGKPNVGKSSLINRLLGQERLLATDVAGTTRDPVDTQVEHEGQTFVFIDTAGIRRKRSIADRLEKFAVMAAMRSIERCDVAVLVLDSTQLISDQDARIVSMAHERGKGVVLVANKWDLIENPEWRDKFPEAVRVDLPFVSYAPLVRLSAKTGKATHKIFAPIIRAQQERHRRISTGELNRFFREVVERNPPALFKGKRPQMYFVSQPLVRPPTFVFTTKNPQNVPESYGRYLRNQLRERFGFEGSPVWLKFRARGRQKARGNRGRSVS